MLIITTETYTTGWEVHTFKEAHPVRLVLYLLYYLAWSDVNEWTFIDTCVDEFDDINIY